MRPVLAPSAASGSRAGRGERDDRQELDRGDGPEREAIDCDVEAGVHDREDDPPRSEQTLAGAIELGVGPPWPPPGSEDHCRRRDPKPGDAEHSDPGEQENRERRAQVMEDGARDEVEMRRHPLGHD